TLVLSSGLLLLLEPALELRDVERDRNHVSVLVDGSRSMVVEQNGTTRQTLAANALEQVEPVFRERADDHIFEYHRFAKDSELASSTSAADLATSSDETWIREALEKIEGRIGRTALGGFVLITDGIDSGTFGGRVAGADRL